MNGKTVTESFATPAAQHKAEREVAAFRRSQELSRELVEVNARICRARPVEESLTPQEKNGCGGPIRAAREVAALLEIVFTGLRRSGQFDLEAVEMATRTAVHQLGARVLEGLLNAPAEFPRAIPCLCGKQKRFHQMRPKRLITALGPITIERPYYVCPECSHGQSPRDVECPI